MKAGDVTIEQLLDRYTEQVVLGNTARAAELRQHLLAWFWTPVEPVEVEQQTEATEQTEETEQTEDATDAV